MTRVPPALRVKQVVNAPNFIMNIYDVIPMEIITFIVFGLAHGGHWN